MWGRSAFCLAGFRECKDRYEDARAQPPVKHALAKGQLLVKGFAERTHRIASANTLAMPTAVAVGKKGGKDQVGGGLRSVAPARGVRPAVGALRTWAVAGLVEPPVNALPGAF